jgi:hypothetical protein
MLETQNPRDTAPMAGNSRSQEPERFVDSVVAAEFLSITPRQLLVMARKGALPAYPLGNGQRRVWRFRLSEIAKALEQQLVGGNSRSAVAIGARRINR